MKQKKISNSLEPVFGGIFLSSSNTNYDGGRRTYQTEDVRQNTQWLTVCKKTVHCTNDLVNANYTNVNL